MHKLAITLTATVLALAGCSSNDPAPTPTAAAGKRAPANHREAVRLAAIAPAPVPPSMCAGLTVTASGGWISRACSDGTTQAGQRIKLLVVPNRVVLFHVEGPGTWVWEGATTVSDDGREASWYNDGTKAGDNIAHVEAVKGANG